MKIGFVPALFAGALACGAFSAAFAQSSEPSYKGDPDVYKVIFEDVNFRVIESLRKKGVHDKPHSHPVPSIVYNITDCKTSTMARAKWSPKTTARPAQRPQVR